MSSRETNPTSTAPDEIADVPVMPVSSDLREEIGRGRSGIVYLQGDGHGHELACKVFNSSGLTKVVQWLTLGAPNPYMWNVDAVKCAKLRRDILQTLTAVWMKGELEVAHASAVAWNNAQMTFELQTRMVRGRPARLSHLLRDDPEDEASMLWRDTMPRLRDHLAQAGFDGLLWQAGHGNPVALNNFLLEPDTPGVPADEISIAKGHWVWIDLESGVPAIFPNNPLVLLGYSLASWWRLGRPMFDDVDVVRLEQYLLSSAEELRDELGDESYRLILSQARQLGKHQRLWKSVGRLQSAMQYQLIQGKIDDSQLAYYTKRPARWIMREFGRGTLALMRTLGSGLKRLRSFILGLDYIGLAHKGWRFLISQKYREEFVHRYLDRSIEQWLNRGQMSEEHAKMLRDQIGSPDSSVYVTDFGIHIAIKPLVKACQYWLVPALFVIGALGAQSSAVLILVGGAIGRSVYTLGRIVQSFLRGYERPWIALVVGVFPVVGNLAFPAQLMHSARRRDEQLARFMMDDSFARIGRHLPIWGGADTWTEHAFNRIPGRLIRFWQQREKRPHRS